MLTGSGTRSSARSLRANEAGAGQSGLKKKRQKFRKTVNRRHLCLHTPPSAGSILAAAATLSAHGECLVVPGRYCAGSVAILLANLVPASLLLPSCTLRHAASGGDAPRRTPCMRLGSAQRFRAAESDAIPATAARIGGQAGRRQTGAGSSSALPHLGRPARIALNMHANRHRPRRGDKPAPPPAAPPLQPSGPGAAAIAA